MTIADDLYASVAPLAYADSDNGNALQALTAALAAMLQPVADLVQDQGDDPGWSLLVDVDRAPTFALPWLAQFVGVRLDAGATDAAQRAKIRDEPSFDRGTVDAIRAVAQALLTGNQTVILVERSGGDAYALDVFTYTSETPDSDAVLAALTAAKPAGLKLTYAVHPGQDWDQLVTAYATWADVVAAYSTWSDVINDTP